MNLSECDDRRNSFRTSYCSPAGYTNGIKVGMGTVENVGPEGMFLETEELFNPGEKINIEFRFRHARQKMDLEGEIVRVARHGLGIKFLWQ